MRRAIFRFLFETVRDPDLYQHRIYGSLRPGVAYIDFLECGEEENRIKQNNGREELDISRPGGSRLAKVENSDLSVGHLSAGQLSHSLNDLAGHSGRRTYPRPPSWWNWISSYCSRRACGLLHGLKKGRRDLEESVLEFARNHRVTADSIVL